MKTGNSWSYTDENIGVIGTDYGYAFQKAGHEVAHFLRASKRQAAPFKLNVTILDGRHDNRGEEKQIPTR